MDKKALGVFFLYIHIYNTIYLNKIGRIHVRHKIDIEDLPFVLNLDKYLVFVMYSYLLVIIFQFP